MVSSGEILLDKYTLYNDHESVVFKYCFSLYHSVNILLGEEMVPVTEVQAVILSFGLLVGEFIHAHIMGTIAVVLASMSRRTSKHQEQIEVASQTMKNIRLSEDLQKHVQDYLMDRQGDIDN